MNDEKLIELVRERSVLYDLSHPKYMDPKYKMSIWQSIGDEMNSTGVQCKNRWTNIRDHFRRHVQKRKTKTGQAAENIKKYKYDDQLQFLVPYSYDRDTLTNVPQQETSSLTEQIIDTFEEAPPEEPNDSEACQPQTSQSAARRTSQSRSKVGRSQNTATSSDTPSAILMKYIIDKNDPQKNTQVPPHDIDTFLAAIGSTMKKLNPYNQHIAKGRIFNVVHELESQELLFPQPPYVPNVLSQPSQFSYSTSTSSASSINMNSNNADSDSVRSLHNLDASRHNDQPLIQQPTAADGVSLREYFTDSSQNSVV